MRLSLIQTKTQKGALEQLAMLVQKSMIHPLVRETAFALTGRGICADRDDMCEVEAIFNAVKYGTETDEKGRNVQGLGLASGKTGLENGVRYVADPRWTDHFTAPHRLLEQCQRGRCQGDCDDQAALVAALLGAIGFQVGLRVWGKSADNYVHVYPVVALPKRSPSNVYGLDTTVEESYVGWEPEGGVTMTAWME